MKVTTLAMLDAIASGVLCLMIIAGLLVAMVVFG